MFDDNHGTEIYGIFSYHRNRKNLGWAHTSNGRFLFFFHRPPMSWNLYNVETLRIPQHRSRKEACAFKTLEKHDSNTRIKGEKITYPCISIRNSIVEIQVSLMREKYRTKLRSSMWRNKELERDRDRIRVADITRRKHQFFPFNPDFVTNRTRHLVKFS